MSTVSKVKNENAMKTSQIQKNIHKQHHTSKMIYIKNICPIIRDAVSGSSHNNNNNKKTYGMTTIHTHITTIHT